MASRNSRTRRRRRKQRRKEERLEAAARPRGGAAAGSTRELGDPPRETRDPRTRWLALTPRGGRTFGFRPTGLILPLDPDTPLSQVLLEGLAGLSGSDMPDA